jgi:superfamily I DNA and/or RNA helicase
MLERQGRMHSEINAFVANRYYEDRLQVVPLPHQTQPLPWKVSSDADPLLTYLATHRMGYFNVTKDYTIGNNKINQPEAQTIASIVQCFYNLYQQVGQPWTPDSAIGIIVPFRGQIAQIRQELTRLEIPQYESITIDTVERYQGSQRDIILFSTVVSQPYQVSILSAPVVTDGSPIDRKLNVAVTRARNQFFLVGNLALLSQAEDYRVLIDYMKAYNSD